MQLLHNTAKNPDKPVALTAQLHGTGCRCAGCRGVALSANLESENEQEVLEAAVNQALTVPDFNRQLDPMVQKAVAVLMACDSYEEAFEALAVTYPDLTSEAHQQYLTSALFISDLLGKSNAKG